MTVIDYIVVAFLLIFTSGCAGRGGSCGSIGHSRMCSLDEMVHEAYEHRMAPQNAFETLSKLKG